MSFTAAVSVISNARRPAGSRAAVTRSSIRERSDSCPRLVPERFTKISTPGRFDEQLDDALDDPSVDGGHQAEPLRRGQEHVGRDQVVRAVPQADEGLEVRDAARVEVDDRLVVEDEPVLAQRLLDPRRPAARLGEQATRRRPCSR